MNNKKADAYMESLDKAIEAIQSDIDYKNKTEFYQVLHARIGAFKIAKELFEDVRRDG